MEAAAGKRQRRETVTGKKMVTLTGLFSTLGQIVGGRVMGALALASFIMLFGFGHEFLGGLEGANVQLALFASFLFGIVCGWKTNR